MELTVCDYTGIYGDEAFDFYRDDCFSAREAATVKYVDLRDISGTNCICDDYALEEIRGRIKSAGEAANGVCLCDEDGAGEFSVCMHFFDNGNYHYMSAVFMSELRGEEFDLVVFDHHPDMKWTSYGEILSCGSWVLNAMKDVPGLGNIYVIGADEKLCREALQDNPECEGRCFFLKSVEELKDMEMRPHLYISVDKDVLSETELATNWDQGDMTLEELESSLRYLKARFENGIVSVDVCGECLVDSSEFLSELGADRSNMINRMIISIFGE